MAPARLQGRGRGSARAVKAPWAAKISATESRAYLAIRFWRDDRLDGSDFEALNKAVSVVAFVAEEGFGLHFSREGLGDVVDLAAGEAERQRVAESVDDHMDLGGRAAARAAYGLVDTPFLRAPALC